MSRIFAVGDIHGCYDKLRRLLDKIPIDFAQDTLLFIGDYIDRGPNSYGVVEHLVQLKRQLPATVFLKGNHEEMFQNYLNGSDRFTYLMNGGQLTLDSYLSRPDRPSDFPIPPSHRDFFQALRLHYETDQYIFVHAGLREGVPLHAQKETDMLWIREKFIYSAYDFGKRIVFGHTPFQQPLLQANKIGIDTGAVYGNKLTCVQLPEINFFSA
jgi:serine/threonine protein phosphatase 1